MESHIIIRGARQHNLKNIEVTLPRDRLTVVTGLSGSGKSTLAFDTLYAEGQRRYVESLSTYARQFLERMDKPEVDLIEGLSPAIAIEQKTAGHNPRSTVGTVTEIYDYLRLLFARVGQPHCYQCGAPITAQSVDEIVQRVLDLPQGTRLLILAPLVKQQTGAYKQLLQRLRKEGFARVRVDGQVLDIENVGRLAPRKPHDIDVVIDRLIIKAAIRNRLADSIELALAQSGGVVVFDVVGAQPMLFSEKAACTRCGITYPEFTPASFSFNSPQGACSTCGGLGATTEFDPALIVPNPALSLREGAIAPWAHRNSVQFAEFLDALARHYRIDIYTPYRELPKQFQKVLLYGSGKEEIAFYFERHDRRYTYRKPFEGIIPKLERLYLETDSQQSRQDVGRYLNHRSCAACEGTKLNRASRFVKIADHNIAGLARLSISQALRFFSTLELGGQNQVIATRILREIKQRLGFLQDVGLAYLTLDRTAQTLSGGESQRIRLATQIGSRLSGVLYVLDEPSIGLHQRDHQKLLKTLLQMRDLGNTVVVVEHDDSTIMAADHVIDMGPGAGINGGEIVYSGKAEGITACEASLTGQYLAGRKQIEVPTRRRSRSKGTIAIQGATANNLKEIYANFPLGCFTCVTGVSGSGKSTLILETLYPALAQRLYQARVPAGPYTRITGLEDIDKVINIDQSPIGRTPRSNPATYTGVFAPMRELFSRTPEARMRGFKPGRFSFNVKGGRCEACRGDGIIKIEMHFLPDVYVACDICHGQRYNRETLEIRYKGKNIAEVLDMTVNQALAFFTNIGNIRQKLQTLVDVGIGYIRLGQPATTLSGGEAQRIKLARELGKKATGRTVYILDEPTTGLHPDDIQKLLNVLNRLVDAGNSVIVIEHNLDVIKTADYIIDLGPEGGDQGGQIIATGSPEELAAVTTSYTGQFLQSVLQKQNGVAR